MTARARPTATRGVDFGDNDVRFARLSLAAAEIAEGAADPNWRPHVVHANDWPTALTPAYIKWKGLDVASILTIHNLAYQGLFDRDRLGALAIPEQAMTIDGVEFHGRVSFLKAGIFYASQVTTVSETYAREITSWEHGCGLDGLLRTRSERGELTGILNGIDSSWETFAREAEDAGVRARLEDAARRANCASCSSSTTPRGRCSRSSRGWCIRRASTSRSRRRR